MTTYVRTRRGKVVHLSGCAVLKRQKWIFLEGTFRTDVKKSDWVWAEDKPQEQIRQVIEELGYHCCRHCQPMQNPQT